MHNTAIRYQKESMGFAPCLCIYRGFNAGGFFTSRATTTPAKHTKDYGLVQRTLLVPFSPVRRVSAFEFAHSARPVEMCRTFFVSVQAITFIIILSLQPWRSRQQLFNHQILPGFFVLKGIARPIITHWRSRRLCLFSQRHCVSGKSTNNSSF